MCCAVAIATHVREVRRLQRGRKTICHDIPSAPGLSSLTQRHQRAPVPIPALVPVLCFCCTASQIYFSNEKWKKKKKRKIFEVRKKKVIASIGRELFPLSAPLPWVFLLP